MEEVVQEEDNLRVVPASEILAKIEEGKLVEYDHVIIKGDIDIIKLDLPKDEDKFLVASAIKITNSKIFGEIDFGNTILKETVSFENTEFTLIANFSGTQFNENSYFIEAQFVFGTSFDKTRFNMDASFLRAKFDLSSSFSGALFEANAWFSQAHFGWDSDFKEAKFNGEANFMEALFGGKSNFNGARFVESVSFSRAEFGSHTCFDRAQFCRKSYFNIAQFYGEIDFSRTQFGGDAYFDGAQIKKDAIFTEAQFSGKADFTEARISGDASFREAKLITDAHFAGALFGGDVLTFRDAEFRIPRVQEDACRRAKNVLERNGNREEAGYHFYREMEARRLQKPWYYRYPEFALVQLIFGYGVHPWRLWAWWFFFVGIFAAIYWIGKGVVGAAQPLDYIWFSITVAVTPGFAGYKPTPGLFQVVAGLEAIFGTFMWAAFIATFARKYMR